MQDVLIVVMPETLEVNKATREQEIKEHIRGQRVVFLYGYNDGEFPEFEVVR